MSFIRLYRFCPFSFTLFSTADVFIEGQFLLFKISRLESIKTPYKVDPAMGLIFSGNIDKPKVPVEKMMLCGILHLYESGCHPKMEYLLFQNNELVVGGGSVFLSYYLTGAFFSSERQKFLNVNSEGKLVLGDRPDTGFRLKNEQTMCCKRSVSYHGFSEFQLCGNGLIGYDSTCPGARMAYLDFIEIL